MKRIIAILVGLFLLTLTGFASAKYIDNGDGTISDTNSNLMWHKTYAEVDWYIANNYCSQSSTGGNYDWRIPTLEELQILVDPAYEPLTVDNYNVNKLI